MKTVAAQSILVFYKVQNHNTTNANKEKKANLYKDF